MEGLRGGGGLVAGNPTPCSCSFNGGNEKMVVFVAGAAGSRIESVCEWQDW